jgi:hypothetical protein
MSGTVKAAKKGHKQRKFGRNKLKCNTYRLHQHKEVNKLRRLWQHVRRHGADKSTTACEMRLIAALTLDRIKSVKQQLRLS